MGMGDLFPYLGILLVCVIQLAKYLIKMDVFRNKNRQRKA